MSVITTVLSIFNKPFPEEESRFGSPRTITIVSIFIVFFLYVFKPFGIDGLEENAFWICLGFGVMTFVATVLYELVMSYVLMLFGGRGQWTFGKWLVNNVGIVTVISLANFLFSRIVVFGYIQWDLFPQMLYGTLMIGIIPVSVLGFYAMMTQERKYMDIATQINDKQVLVESEPLASEIRLYDIAVDRIRYVEALQNYVTIGYIDDDGILVNRSERSTLKQVIAVTAGSSLVRCHRSYLVHRDAIINISGNAQGLLLTLADCDRTIPVSRSYVAQFRN